MQNFAKTKRFILNTVKPFRGKVRANLNNDHLSTTAILNPAQPKLALTFPLNGDHLSPAANGR
jgi:hypothetical protein